LGKSSAVASWQSGFCLLFKLFSDLLSVGAVQTCASTQWQSDFGMTLLKKIRMEKNITPKNTNQALRDTNADKTTVLLSHLRNNYGFIVGYCC